MSIISVREIFQ